MSEWKKRWKGLSCAGCAIQIAIIAAVLVTFAYFFSKMVFSVIAGAFSWLWGLLGGFISSGSAMVVQLPFPGQMLVASIFLILVGTWAARRSRDRQWQGLSEIRSEYEAFRAAINPKTQKTYAGRVEGMIQRLLEQKARLDVLQTTLNTEIPRIDSRIAQLRSRMLTASAAENIELEPLVEELKGHKIGLEARRTEIQSFDRVKLQMASQISCLRLRLTSGTAAEAAPEIDGLIRGMDDLLSITVIVDQAATYRQPPTKTEPVGKP